jgi:hypothetical protein
MELLEDEEHHRPSLGQGGEHVGQQLLTNILIPGIEGSELLALFEDRPNRRVEQAFGKLAEVVAGDAVEEGAAGEDGIAEALFDGSGQVPVMPEILLFSVQPAHAGRKDVFHRRQDRFLPGGQVGARSGRGSEGRRSGGQASGL